jgi:hypothetical protein
MTDWEKLIAKCAADLEYRTNLASALAENDDEAIGDLLDQIEVGSEGAARAARISALKAARQPMEAVTEAFDAVVAVAP